MEMYKRVKQLNSKKSRAAGAIITVDKNTKNKNDSFASFIRINDCHNTIYLHSRKNIHHCEKAKKKYIKKVKKLKKEIDLYLEHLESI